jgi:outer membrane receptor protein involved in Fe transport
VSFSLAVSRTCQCRFFVVLAFLVLSLSALLSGQAYFGTVSGDLTDSSGAMVQGAKVTLRDEQKGYQFTTTSDKDGRYLFASIPPGMYSVTAEAHGFEKTVRTHITLNVSENAAANIVMKVGGETQKVDVKAESQSIATEDATTGQVVDRRFINDLPIIDRTVTELTYLTAGVTDMDDQCHNCGGTNFVSNGSRGASADILMDGASITNFEPNGGVTQAVYTPSPEAVEEFKVQQTNFSAEYGFSGASILNMVTRSGTNQFHGSVYDFIRNTITDANDWFNDRNGIPIPPVHRHDFGGTIGGPILKDRTFFFFDYEGLRASSMQTYFAGVPDQAMRNGDFGEVCSTNGGSFNTSGACVDNTGAPLIAGQLFDPYSGYNDPNFSGPHRQSIIPFNNVGTYISPGTAGLPIPPSPALPAQYQPTPGVPGNLIDPVAQKIMNLFPMPTASFANPTIYKNWTVSGATPNSNDQLDLKIDHRFTQKNLVSVKYSQDKNSNTPFDCFNNVVDPCGSGANESTAHVFAINDAYTIKPTLLLTSTFGITRGAMRIFAYNSSHGADPLGMLGFPEYLKANGFNGVPALFINDYTSAGSDNVNAGNDPYGNYKQGQTTGQLSFVLSNIRGPHELKFGFEARLHQQNYIQTNAPLGFFQFTNTGSSLCPFVDDFADCGGDSMASFLMGQLLGNGGSTYEIQFQPATENYQYAWFGQDNWKVTPKLTLNLGLRYDVSLPRTDRFNHQNWFDPNVTNPLNGGKISYTDPVTGAAVTVPLMGGEVFTSSKERTNYVTDWHDIQPRFGFAYQFAPKMVVRGGYGIYYGQSRSGASGVVPYGNAGFDEYTNVISTYQNAGASPWLHLNNPYPNGLNQPAGSSLGLLNDVGYGANGPLRIEAANRTPYEQSWSLGFERQMPWNVVFEVEYLGKKGTHLPFSGTNSFDILGPWVESLPLTSPNPNNPCATRNISCLNSFVTNPFASVNGGPISDPNSTLSSPTIQYVQLLLPEPQFTGVTTDVQMTANSTFHALQLEARKAFTNGLEFLVNYTWSKSIDDASVGDDNVTWLGSFTSIQDPNKPWLERSLSTFDTPSVLKFSYSYDLPFGRGRMLGGNMPRVLNTVIGGWKTNGIWSISDGRPLAITVSNGGTPIPGYGGYVTQRPNITGTLKRNYGPDWQDQFFADPNTAPTPNNSVGDILNIPAPFTFGNMPRTTAQVRSPLVFTSDLSVAKQFALSSKHEGIFLEMRLEAQNAFNHPLFSLGTPGPYGDSTLNVGDPSFGIIPRMSPVGPRQVQLAAKISF